MIPHTGAGAPLALTMGEPAGVGGELALMAWLRRRDEDLPPFLLLDGAARVTALARRLYLPVPVQAIETAEAAVEVFDTALPVLDLGPVPDVAAGRPEPEAAPFVLRAIETAVHLTRRGETAAVVTNPIHKGALYAAGFRHPGHTEYLADLAAQPGAPPPTPVMMLAGPSLRVVPATIHIALSAVPQVLSSEALETVCRITLAALSAEFGCVPPRLAVAGLNPHAGEGGAMGDEEARLIAPVIDRLAAEGHAVTGPHPGDTLFHAAARARYDAAVCMYHDQALIPVKTLDFDRAVNVTLGLPFVRTSPDHGTAFDIAGRGIAEPTSLICALRLAAELAARRRRAASDAAGADAAASAGTMRSGATRHG